MRKIISFATAVAASALVAAPIASHAAKRVSTPPPLFNPGYSAPWMQQIGLTADVINMSQGGKGFTIAFIDTGVTGNSVVSKDRISTLSICTITSTKCKNAKDQNGHGTATAAIAAALNLPTGLGMMGVAPQATMLEEKALNSYGAGSEADVAVAIRQAADSGAHVINLSISYVPTPMLVAAMSYATDRGVIIVYAGGNQAGLVNNGFDSLGFSPSALSHFVFVGSVDGSNNKSSFSNAPGTASMVTDKGSAGYASLWLMAPGENIIAPDWSNGNGYYKAWSGTSMSAPMVAGALALLETTWPILDTNGTALSVLFASATDLGDPGTDAVYGNGLLNIARAFQPIGQVDVPSSSGSVPVGSLSSTTVSGGAMGDLVKVSSVLSNFTVFDTYQRNFKADFSPLLQHRAAAPAGVSNILAANTIGGGFATRNGGQAFVAYGDMQFAPGAAKFASDPMAAGGVLPQDASYGAYLFTSTAPNGATVATGQGFSAVAAFSDSLWGDRHESWLSSGSLGQAYNLMSIASGGRFGAMGLDLDATTRLAVAVSGNDRPIDWANRGLGNATAMAATVGLTERFTDTLTGGATFTMLREGNSLLGTAYNNGSLSLGSSHASTSATFTLSLALDADSALMAEGTLARTGGSRVGEGLISGTTTSYARTLGLSFIDHRVFGEHDALSVMLAKPLRSFAGSVGIVMGDIEANGTPYTTIQQIGLSPSGDETDLSLGYRAMLSDTVSLDSTLKGAMDADNIRGAVGGEANLRLHITL